MQTVDPTATTVPREGKPVFTVAVRDLVEFVLRQGDLAGAGKFSGVSRALEGIRGHQRLQRARPAGYERELLVSQECETPTLVLRVQGRIDGVWPNLRPVRLEEIKTLHGAWDGVADPLHWAQLKCYAWFYACRSPQETLALQLTYLDLESGQTTEFQEEWAVSDLGIFFQAVAEVYLEWVEDQQRWRRCRDESLRGLRFPFSTYRSGQRRLAVAAYRTLAGGGRLFAAAATGIGKTLGVIFPALKALGEGQLEQVYFLTARTVGRLAAEQALAELRAQGLRARALVLAARERVCVREGAVCDLSTCPLALGYYDRLKPAMREALADEALDLASLDRIGRRHQVCPYELARDLAAWVDVVIGDYNYAFDPHACLRRRFDDEGRAYGFLIDEAHNLVDRAREMFSASLDSATIREALAAIREPLPAVARVLRRLNSSLRAWVRSADSAADEEPSTDPTPMGDLFATLAVPAESARQTREASASPADTAVYRLTDIPRGLSDRLTEAIDALEGWLALNRPAPFRESALALYFELVWFQRVQDSADDCFAVLVNRRPGLRVRLFCLDPSSRLRELLRRGKAAVFFSATLTPSEYYRALLGGESHDPVRQIPSPFPPENLAILVHDRIQTEWKAREATVHPVTEAIAAFVRAKPGNYLVYLPSFQYLQRVAEAFRRAQPELQTLLQRPSMPESERAAFLSAFSAGAPGTLVGFAVMGGVFGEGIDLVGDRLLGVAIVGVGLPQLCLERDLMRGHFEAHGRDGFDYAYVFPGMNRVLQAAGRVIRTETDRGAVLLIDSRFGQERYRRLMPPWWHPRTVRTPRAIQATLADFWSGSLVVASP